ncbi:hypothetical protein PTTG_00785 [Puccinia triticina 1-1 BBBD Race 1]|uniref:Uncharacterized protein n=1 Tax=Puccinia triticina (isolate 1-1 / race 1 (BBBD)) TaxID=630390 RepID=A0A0C4EJ68_PUCT1|nr:hypothetical protein PTTG_00785 [Puccinia triticina 1-1 BBBD Race 1]
MEHEPELFERVPVVPTTSETEDQQKDAPPTSGTLKPTTPPSKVRFECGIVKDHPDAADVILKKMFDVTVPNVTISELLAMAPSVAEGMKN